MTHAAKGFGISDVALRKTCVKHSIPTPPLGYWAKLLHGKEVHKPPLPKLKDDAGATIHLTEKPEQDLPIAVREALVAARAKEEASETNIVLLTERPKQLHPVTLATEKTLSRAKADAEGFLHCGEKNSLAIQVGSASIERVILLVETILRAYISRGCVVSSGEEGAQIICDGEPFDLRLYETKNKKPYELTRADIKRQADYDEDTKRMPTLYPAKKVTPTWAYYPSGRLCFEITDPTKYRWNSENIVGRWYDRTNKSVDQYIAESIVSVAGAAAHNKILRAEEEERKRLHAEKLERQRREEALRKQIKEQKDYLKGKAAQFDELRKLRALAEHLETQVKTDDRSSFNRMLVILREMLATSGQQFTGATMNEEVEKLGLLKLEGIPSNLSAENSADC
jgi:hypothetical protein